MTIHTVQIDDHLQSVIGSPTYGFLEVGQLAINVWLAAANFKGPVSDRQPNMVEAIEIGLDMAIGLWNGNAPCGCNLGEVVFLLSGVSEMSMNIII